MKLNTTVTRSQTGRALVLGASMLGLCACAHKPSPQLVDAREAYRDAAAGPARTLRPNELSQAREALDRAERAHDEDPRSQRERRLAREAERKALLAHAHGEAVDAEQAARAAERDGVNPRARADAAMRDTLRDDARLERERDSDDARPGRVRGRGSDAALQRLAAVANVREEPRGVVVTLSGSLLFPNGEPDLSPIARRNVEQVADALAEQPADTKFVVQGYTDETGSARENKQLSAQRARAVAAELEEAGIDRERIEVESYGEGQPIAGNATPQSRAIDRRVEIVIEPKRGGQRRG